MKKNLLHILIALTCLAGVFSCKKEFLNAKPDKSLVIPSTISEFQDILDNGGVMNQGPVLSEIASDDIYTTTAGYNGAQLVIKNSYLWKSDIYQGQVFVGDWNTPYQCIYYANIVLDGLNDLSAGNATTDQINKIKGAALFYRAMAFYGLAQEFTMPYNENTADKVLGIPIRLTSDVQVKSNRGTLRETYRQIINDLTSAQDLLPLTDDYKMRPVKSAALGLLSRVYLVMGDFTQAKSYADKYLALNNKLLNYNALAITAPRPFPASFKTGNDEVIYYHLSLSYAFLTSPSVAIIDSVLYNSYDGNDLRKTAFFNNKGKGVILFKGNYTGSGGVFSGIATDEVYLTRAECNARVGNKDEALKDLNTLLLTRWKTNTFIPYTAVNADDALLKILAERRKELIYRNMRWSDLKRLNEDTKTETVLTKTLNGDIFTLKPKDIKYAFPIPDAEISASGIQQNVR